MINYIEKGDGLHEAIFAAGLALWEEPVGWTTGPGQEFAVQQIIDTYDPVAPALASKWKAIQDERDRRKHAGFMTDGHRFHSDPDSRIQQLGLVMMGDSMPSGIMWKTMDGTFVPMTPALASAIFQTTASADVALFTAAENHRAVINAMTDWKQITDYDFSGGWPEV